jgi:hypothetical protein
MEYVACWVFTVIISSMIGVALGDSRGRGGAGLALGFLLGPLGCLIVLLIPRTIDKEAERQLAVERRAAELRTELAHLEGEQARAALVAKTEGQDLGAEQARAAAPAEAEQRSLETEQRRAALLAEAARRGDVEERDFRLWLAQEIEPPGK